MIEASKLKAGMTFETADGKLIRVWNSHHKPGKGNTIMRMKLRVRHWFNIDTKLPSRRKFEQAIIKNCSTQYLA